MKKRKRDLEHAHEPSLEGDEWVECGGELVWAVGFTEAGFPYGIREEEWRRSCEQVHAAAGWARAKRILEIVVAKNACDGAEIAIGRIKKIGQGLSREVFAAEVEVESRSAREVAALAVLLPRRGCDADLDERTLREARLLADLSTMGLPFRVPRIVGVHPDGSQLAMVRTCERGIELDLRAGRQERVRPWQTVGEIAAAVHAITSARVSWIEPRYATRLDHAMAAIAALDDADEPEMAGARAWMLANLPPAVPSVLVHGDLLGQNILLGLDEPDAVIDWEYAQFGDPAYDLAVVTRGVRRPFQMHDGLDRLLDAHNRANDGEVKREHVHLHELSLAARWYREALERDGPHAASTQLQFFRGLLRRVAG